MLLLLLLLGAVAFLFYKYCTWNNEYFKKLGVPHMDPKFFVGNTPNGLLQKRNVYYDIEDVYNKYRGKFRFCGLFSFRKPTVLVLDAGLTHEVLVTNFNKFSFNDFADIIDKDIDPILGYNPFFLNGHEWKDRRAEITPAFTVARLRAMYPLITDVCQNLSTFIDKESRLVGSDGVDARELFGRYTVDVVSNCIFAVDAGSLKDKEAIIQRRAKELFKPSLRIVFLFVLNELCPGVNKFLRVPFISKELEQFFAKLMKDAATHRRQSGVEKSDVLQFLLTLQDKKNLNDVELVANAITFFLDGFETSSLSMSLTMFEVANNKRVQDKLRAEILEAEQKGPLTMESIAELPYLDQVVHEGLRLNAPAVMLQKRSIEDVELALTDDGKTKVKFPKGTVVTIPVQSIHRDPANYKDPLEFIPERFDADQGGVKAYKDKGMFVAFGDGPRICLGMRFALTQLKAGMVEVLKNFEVTVNKKTQVPLVMDPKEFLTVPLGKTWLDFKRL